MDNGFSVLKINGMPRIYKLATTEDGKQKTVGGGLNIARTLGDFFFKIDHDDPSLNKPAQAISSQPDIREVNLSKDSGSFLLIGCDGVWEATDFSR